MISNYMRGPKNPFNQSLKQLQKSRQETSIEQYEDEVEGFNKEDQQIQFYNNQKYGLQNTKEDKHCFFSPQYSQQQNQQMFFKSNNANNNMNDQFYIRQQSKQQQSKVSPKKNENIQIDNTNFKFNTNNQCSKDLIEIKNLDFQQQSNQVIIKPEQIQQNREDKNEFKDYQNDSQFDSQSQKSTNLQDEQKSSSYPQKSSFYQNYKQFQNNQNKNDNQQQNHTESNLNKKNFTNNQSNQKESDTNYSNLNENYDIDDEQDQYSQQNTEKNKFPNESIYSKNNEYFIQNHSEHKIHDILSEDTLDSYENRLFDSPNINDQDNQMKVFSSINHNVVGSNIYKNGYSTNTFSPRTIQKMNQQGIVFGNSSQNQNGLEGLSSFYQGLNSTIGSNQQLPSLHPLLRNHSTSSFKTILKKDKNTIERTDSNNTIQNTDSQIKKNGKVKFNQLNLVVNYEEDILEKTDHPYVDQMFQSDELEDESLSFPQVTQNGSPTNRNKRNRTKITVLEKNSEKEKDNKMNSSLINSNINIKESDMSYSSNLIAIKSKSQNRGSGISTINNIQNSSSIAQDDLQYNQNIQDLVQSKQDSLIFSQINISPLHKQFSSSKDEHFLLFPISNNQQFLSSDNNIDHKKDIPSILSLKSHQNYDKRDSFFNINNINCQTNKHKKTISQQSTKTDFNNNTTFRTVDSQKNIEQPSIQYKQQLVYSENKVNKNQKIKEQQIESNKSSNNQHIQQQQQTQTLMNQKSENEMNSFESNLETIMCKIQVTHSNKNKQMFQSKQRKTCKSSCNIFSYIWT